MKSAVKWVLRILSLVPAILLLCVIFRFSAQNGTSSTGQSMRVGRLLVRIFNTVFSLGLSDEEILKEAARIDFPVRKIAHISEYCALTLSFYLPLRVFHTPGKPLVFKRLKNGLWEMFITSAFAAVLCASFDEFHQYFVPGRSGQPIDILVDSVGICIATGVLILAYRRKLFGSRENR